MIQSRTLARLLLLVAVGVALTGLWFFLRGLGMLPMTVVFAGLGRGFQVHPVAATIAGVMLLLAMFVAPYYLQRFYGEQVRRMFR